MLLATAAWAQHQRGSKSPAPQSSALILLRYTPPEGSQWVYEEESFREEEQRFLDEEGSSTTITAVIRALHRYHVLRSTDTLLISRQPDSVAFSLSFDASTLIDTVFVPLPSGITTVYTMSPSGRFLSKTEEVHDSSTARRLNAANDYGYLSHMWSAAPPLFALLPDTPVRVGQQWNVERRDTVSAHSRQLGRYYICYALFTNTLEALVDTLGRRCARIRITVDSLSWYRINKQEGLGIVTLEGTAQESAIAYLELDTGMPLVMRRRFQEEATFSIAEPVGLVGSISISATLSIRRR